MFTERRAIAQENLKNDYLKKGGKTEFSEKVGRDKAMESIGQHMDKWKKSMSGKWESAFLVTKEVITIVRETINIQKKKKKSGTT
jgi:hypothetical protein